MMVARQNGSIVTVPLDQVIDKHKQLPLDHTWITERASGWHEPG